MTIYAVIHSSGGDSFVAYEGMNEQQVTAMLTAQGWTVEFLTADEYTTKKTAATKA